MTINTQKNYRADNFFCARVRLAEGMNIAIDFTLLYDIGEIYLMILLVLARSRSSRQIYSSSFESIKYFDRIKIRPVSTDYHGFNNDRINSRPFVIRVQLKEKLPVWF